MTVRCVQQELLKDNVVCQRQPYLNNNCQLVCVKSKVKFFVYDSMDNDDARSLTMVLQTCSRELKIGNTIFNNMDSNYVVCSIL